MLLFNTAGSCWLKHFPACFCLLVGSSDLSSHRRSVRVKRLLRPSVWAARVQSANLVPAAFDRQQSSLVASFTWKLEALCWCSEAFCSELIKIDWPSFQNRWRRYFSYACLPGCVLINDKAIFCVKGRAQFTFRQDERNALAWQTVQGHEGFERSNKLLPFCPINSLLPWKCW